MGKLFTRHHKAHSLEPQVPSLLWLKFMPGFLPFSMAAIRLVLNPDLLANSFCVHPLSARIFAIFSPINYVMSSCCRK